MELFRRLVYDTYDAILVWLKKVFNFSELCYKNLVTVWPPLILLFTSPLVTRQNTYNQARPEKFLNVKGGTMRWVSHRQIRKRRCMFPGRPRSTQFEESPMQIQDFRRSGTSRCIYAYVSAEIYENYSLRLLIRNLLTEFSEDFPSLPYALSSKNYPNSVFNELQKICSSYLSILFTLRVTESSTAFTIGHRRLWGPFFLYI